MDFTGQHVVITGGATGIGKATAERIVGTGGKVTLIARRAEVLAQAVRELGAAADFIVADVGDQPQILAAFDLAVERHGPMDGLFLNAGAGGSFAATADYTDEAFEHAIRINVLSPFWSIRHVLPAMMARGRGALLLAGSLASHRGMAGNIGYLVSKHGTLGLAMSIAMEAAPKGVRCNCIVPGFVETDMLAAAPEAAKALMEACTPQGRLGRPAEAAAVAAFLLSDEASHVTAQSWAVDGGILGTLRI